MQYDFWFTKVYEQVNISDDQVYERVLFSKVRCMNGVDFEILARKPYHNKSQVHTHSN